MHSSDAGEGNSQNSGTQVNLSKSGSSTSTFTRSSSSSSSIVIPHSPKRKTMEELWKDINLSTLGHESVLSTPLVDHHKSSASAATVNRQSYRSIILQDFLAGASKNPPSSTTAAAASDVPILPTTALSLSTSGLVLGAGFQYETIKPNHCISNSTAPFFSDDVIGSPPPSALFSFYSNKRPLETPSYIASGDRHHKRMMKNRESAARSRARKQAYTNELELEVAHLAEENSKLRKQNEELRSAMAAQTPKKHALQKTSSAPF
ncbi:hypothetical protein HPP92_021862 [Vanilla planifolia]|uniref:BZIP domain-containing protein n=1 Tax=Vanilla planifolia TaxID=51239 RepID=A0A835PSB7_VANPL|nr:hypothetical protein HPP92_022194 [Vanilla planifolia]KAG0458734.1 hypothetical protein HPP92_021862 [Vanilla planifolia]